MIKVIVNGAKGKMGSLACQALAEQADFQVVAALGRGDDLPAAIFQHQADLVVDLTRADCALSNARQILSTGAKAVIGTSGLSEADLQCLQDLCAQKSTAALVVPNFSIGAILMMQFAQQAAKWLPDVEIIEYHHTQKQDAPSGTAVKTAELMAQVMPQPSSRPDEKILYAGARGAQVEAVRVHAIRLPGFLAKQQVVFGQLGESLTIEHQCIDRQAYMPGLILACRQVMRLQGLHVGLDELMAQGQV